MEKFGKRFSADFFETNDQAELYSSLFHPVAGHLASIIQSSELRDLFDTALISVRTTTMENAAGGQVDRGWDFSLKPDMAARSAFQLWNGTHQCLGVRMTRIFEEESGFGKFAHGP